MKAKCALWLAENEKDTAQVLLVFFSLLPASAATGSQDFHG